MLNRIQNALRACGIDIWRILETEEETAELFFVKKELDTRRIKDTRKWLVTVFRKENRDGQELSGETTVTVTPAMDDVQIEHALKDAFFAAQFALNPSYELPDPVKAETVRKTGFLAESPLSETAKVMTEALFAADKHGDAFLNSAELFIVKKASRVIASTGTDVSWTDGNVNGEYVVQCKEPEDVEMHHSFKYDECRPEELTKAVDAALMFVRDRARAQKILKSGNYDILLTGEELSEMFSYYGFRSNASAVYAHYSDWEEGRDVQGPEDGEPIDLTLTATAPYNGEGLPMRDFPLLRGGKLQGIYGETRFCRYLGIEPTGQFRKSVCGNPGTETFEEMKKRPCLWAVSFSDFQMDAFSGHFGGEIRLAYLIEDGKAIPVTGGSLNGNLLEAQKHVRFSKERFACADYEGPYAMLLPDVPVAGSDSDE